MQRSKNLNKDMKLSLENSSYANICLFMVTSGCLIVAVSRDCFSCHHAFNRVNAECGLVWKIMLQDRSLSVALTAKCHHFKKIYIYSSLPFGCSHVLDGDLGFIQMA